MSRQGIPRSIPWQERTDGAQRREDWDRRERRDRGQRSWFAWAGVPVTAPTAARNGRNGRNDPADGAEPVRPEPLAPPPVLRRRPVHLVAGLLAMALGAVFTAWLFVNVGNTRSVLALRQDVARGEAITAEDLMAVDLSPDPALRVVPADQRQQVVGRRAAIDLAAGGLLVDTAVTTDLLPAQGQALVGLWLTPGQLPGTALHPGDAVRVVNTPRAQDDAPTGRPRTTAATVVATETSPDGHVLVTVTVPTGAAAPLSALAATGRIAVVVDSAAR